MEFEAKLKDQISEPAAAGTEGLDKMATATKKLDAQLRAIDTAQRRAADKAAVQAKGFNPEQYKRQLAAERELAAAKKRIEEQLNAAEPKKKGGDKAKKDTPGGESGTAALAKGAKGAAVAFLALAGASSALDVAKIAIGYQGMARLQMIGQRATMNFRALFRGVDSKPLERGLSRVTDLVNGATPAGRAIGDLLTRSFNSAFKSLERAAPYVEAFGQGVILAALYGEQAWLRFRIATVPIVSALKQATGGIDGMKTAAYAGVGVMGLLGTASALAGVKAAYAGISAGLAWTKANSSFLLAAAAIAAVAVALDQANKLSKEWDSGVVKRSLGIDKGVTEGYDKMLEREAAQRKAAGKKSVVVEGDAAAIQAAKAGTGAAEQTGAPAAQKSGAAIGDGVVAGMKSKEAEVEAAGKGLAAAADRGVKTAAEIRSPSRKMRREVGAQLGAGVAVGMKDSAPRIEKEAERSLVPELTNGGAARPAGGRAAAALTLPPVQFNNCTFGGATPGDVRAAVDEAMTQIAMALGARFAVRT